MNEATWTIAVPALITGFLACQIRLRGGRCHWGLWAGWATASIIAALCAGVGANLPMAAVMAIPLASSAVGFLAPDIGASISGYVRRPQSAPAIIGTTLLVALAAFPPSKSTVEGWLSSLIMIGVTWTIAQSFLPSRKDKKKK